VTPSRGLAVLVVVALVAAALRLATGPVAVDDGIVVAVGMPRADLLPLRLSAVLSASALGAALALSGLALQVLLRNPLASPFVLGVSSGAGFGVALVLALAWRLAIPSVAFGGEVGGAIAGACATIVLVGWLGGARRGGDPTALVLAGVVAGAILSAGTMLVEQLVPFGLRGDLLSWMAGRLPELPSRGALATMSASAVAGLVVLQSLAPALDVACLSDDEARSSGVRLDRLRATLFLVGGTLAAVAVAYAGPVGFVGLLGPHLARRIVGASHRVVVPATAVAGVALLLVADLARQAIDLGTGRLPIGVVTALAGGPAFLILLRRRGAR
jgi:iron complex transport system permease protein